MALPETLVQFSHIKLPKVLEKRVGANTPRSNIIGYYGSILRFSVSVGGGIIVKMSDMSRYHTYLLWI